MKQKHIVLTGHLAFALMISLIKRRVARDFTVCSDNNLVTVNICTPCLDKTERENDRRKEERA